MKLTKSTYDSVIAGVCGGVAEAFGWDSNLIRIAFILFSFFGVGSPILLYLILALVMPKEF